ncbi:hypothetical protein [Rathayibacter soli]|uniref:hypothetical protein n=1 Tax=Rathayibacter soli TaxID=3144168 RepID=UPI0027E4DC7E|nr:hypothetical protein [Glaciibacter superstes]
MPHRRKPLWRWEPAGYILLFLLLFVTSALQVTGPALAFWILVALSVVAALVVVAGLFSPGARGRLNPDAYGNLSTLNGLTIVPAPASDVPRTVVADSIRHQNAIDAAAAFGGDSLSAVLVPRATRWLGRRYRVAVHLIAGANARIFHAGFLPLELGEEWDALLVPLRADGRYLRVPAAVIGDHRPFSVELDLGSVAAALRKANEQSA